MVDEGAARWQPSCLPTHHRRAARWHLRANGSICGRLPSPSPFLIGYKRWNFRSPSRDGSVRPSVAASRLYGARACRAQLRVFLVERRLRPAADKGQSVPRHRSARHQRGSGAHLRPKSTAHEHVALAACALADAHRTRSCTATSSGAAAYPSTRSWARWRRTAQFNAVSSGGRRRLHYRGRGDAASASARLARARQRTR